jgi:predicted proteasome-type protease
MVPKPNGDYRLVVDMRKINQFMKLIHFKMEGTPTLKQLMMKNNCAISGSIIQISEDAVRSERRSKSLHTNHEKSDTSKL